MSSSKQVPAVGSTVRPVGSEVTYRVVSASAHGCYVEAISTEVSVPGRKPRPLHYSEKRATLAVRSDTGGLFDDRWRGWELVS